MLCNIDASPIYPCPYKEHSLLPFIYKLYFGLSLCIQGTLICIIACERVTRFIPVCTGNATWSDNGEPDKTVYPCVYRERTNALIDCRKLVRFIPVCTGNAPIITYCFIIKILTVKFLPIF